MKVSAISNYQNIYRANRNNNQPQPQPAPIPAEPKNPELNFGGVGTRTTKGFLCAAILALGAILSSCIKDCGCNGPIITKAENKTTFIINSCGDTIAQHTDSITPDNPPVHPHKINIDDSCWDMFCKSLGMGENGSSEWEGPNNIAGHAKLADWGLNQLIEADIDTIRYNNTDTVAYNTVLKGRVYDVNGAPVGNGNFNMIMEKVPLSPGQVFPGSNAQFGVVMSNPLDSSKKYIYVPNNSKSAIFVFEWNDGKATAIKGFKPTPELGYASEGVSPMRDIPNTCYVYFVRNADGDLLIYAKGENGLFFPKAGLFEVTNKEGKKED